MSSEPALNTGTAFPALLSSLLPVTQTPMQRVTIGTVSLRDLRNFLAVTEGFTPWFVRLREKLALVEHRDFRRVDGPSRFGRPQVDYRVPLAVASRFANEGSRTDRARQAITYLSACYEEDYALRMKAQAVPPRKNVGSDIVAREVLRKAKGYDVPLAVVAKRLGVGEVRLFEFLRSQHILTRGGKNERNLPLQRYLDQGWFRVSTRSFEREETPWVYSVTLVTPRGFSAIRDTLDKLPRDQFEALK